MNRAYLWDNERSNKLKMEVVIICGEGTGRKTSRNKEENQQPTQRLFRPGYLTLYFRTWNITFKARWAGWKWHKPRPLLWDVDESSLHCTTVVPLTLVLVWPFDLFFLRDYSLRLRSIVGSHALALAAKHHSVPVSIKKLHVHRIYQSKVV